MAALDVPRDEESEYVGLPDGQHNNMVHVAGFPMKYSPKVTPSAPNYIMHWQSLVDSIGNNVTNFIKFNTPGISLKEQTSCGLGTTLMCKYVKCDENHKKVN